jgi:elongation factor P
MLEQREMEYLYSDGEMHHFMNTETYEQLAMSEDDLGDAAKWLMPNLKIEVEFYEETPIGVELPQSMDLVITETEPVLKGATASNSNKPATLENGVTLYVPPFMTERYALIHQKKNISNELNNSGVRSYLNFLTCSAECR